MSFRRCALLLFLTACGDADAQEPIELASICAEVEGDSWESAGWPPTSRCEWLRFEGRTTVRLAHDLGRTPRSIQVYLSFEPDGRLSAASAGDLTRIVSADDMAVELRNDTEEDFFLKVVLR